eukprot:COSAG01_NODE_415_length_17322_cov_14.785926_4_plen_258_part_00
MTGAPGVFATFAVLYVGAAFYMPLASARNSIISRAQLGVKAGWVRLHLGESQPAVDAFQAVHDELLQGAGPDSLVGWHAAPGLVQALKAANNEEQANEVRRELAASIASNRCGWRRWRRIFCTMDTATEMAEWYVVRASLVLDSTSDVLDLLEHAAEEGLSKPVPRSPHWDKFVAGMASDGGVIDADRARWMAFLQILVENDQRTKQARKQKFAVLVLVLATWFTLLAYSAIGKLYCVDQHRPNSPPVFFTFWCQSG